jgi:outer membrane protein assembly factor BamE
MLEPIFFRRTLTLVVLGCLGLAGCSNTGSRGLTNILTPYKIDMVQGNVVTREQMEAVSVGMPRAQVRSILGTPLLSSVFHAERWDYVFSLRRQGAELQSRRIALFFKGDLLDRIEADPLPSESEFVATLRSLDKVSKLPSLEATEDSLKKFPVAAKPATPAPLGPGAPDNYPPLEPARP